jgi:hypothetical protein
MVLAGWVGAAWSLQALLLVPTLMVYLTPAVDGWPRTVVLTVFVPLMLVALAAWAFGWWRLVVVPRPVDPTEQILPSGSIR